MNFETSFKRYCEMSVGDICHTQLRFWDGVNTQDKGVKMQQITALAIASITGYCYLRGRGPQVFQSRVFVLSLSATLLGVELLRNYFYKTVKGRQDTALENLSGVFSAENLDLEAAKSSVKTEKSKLNKNEWHHVLLKFAGAYPSLFIPYEGVFSGEDELAKSDYLVIAFKSICIVDCARESSLFQKEGERAKELQRKSSILTKEQFAELLEKMKESSLIGTFTLLQRLLSDKKFATNNVEFPGGNSVMSEKASLTMMHLLKSYKNRAERDLSSEVKYKALIHVYKWAVETSNKCTIFTFSELREKSRSRFNPGFSKEFYRQLELDIDYEELKRLAK